MNWILSLNNQKYISIYNMLVIQNLFCHSKLIPLPIYNRLWSELFDGHKTILRFSFAVQQPYVQP